MNGISQHRLKSDIHSGDIPNHYFVYRDRPKIQ